MLLVTIMMTTTMLLYNGSKFTSAAAAVVERLPSVADHKPQPLPCWLLLAVVVRGGAAGRKGLCYLRRATAHPDTSLQPQEMNSRGQQHYQTDYTLYDADELPMLVNLTVACGPLMIKTHRVRPGAAIFSNGERKESWALWSPCTGCRHIQ